MRTVREPIAGESLDGYLAYRAERMGLPNILEIAELAGIDGHCRVRVSRCDSGFEDLGDLLGMPAATLEELASPSSAERWRRRFFGLSLHVMHVERDRRVFAPEALARSPHHRALWDLRPFPFDEGTWEILVHRCPDPDCLRPQGWHHTRGIDSCDGCGRLLAGETGAVVPYELRPFLRDALGLVHPDPDRHAACAEILPAILRDVDRGELLDLLVGLTGVVDPDLRSKHSRWCIRPNAEPVRVLRAVARAWPLLVGWPDAFEALALDRASTTPRGRGDGNEGATSRFLSMSRTLAAPNGLSRILEVERRRLEDAGRNAIAASAANALPGLRAGDVSRARREGRIRTVASMRRGLFIPMLVRAEVEQFSSDFAETLPLRRAAAMLGCGRLGVEQLSVMGLLGPQGPELPLTGNEPRVSVAGLRALSDRLESNSTKTASKAIALSEALRSYGGGSKPVGPLVQAVLRGDLVAEATPGDGPILSRLLVSECDASAIRGLSFDRTAHGGRLFVDTVSGEEAAHELNLRSTKCAPLLLGWKQEGKMPFVPVPWLLEVMEVGVSVGEIAMRLGVHGRAVNGMLARARIPEVLPALYGREAVEAMIMASTGAIAASR